MKKGKYIDYNILLACLSKRPQAMATIASTVSAQKDIVQEFYETLCFPVATGTAGRPGTASRQDVGQALCI